MRIIAFGHKKRVGKDTAVRFALSFARQYYPQLQCKRLSFGDQIKELAYRMFRWGGLQDAVYYTNHEHEIEEILPAIGKSPRQIWDEIGHFGASLCPSVWPEMALERIDGDVLFTSDLRRPIEANYAKKFNGACYRIDRDDAPKSNHQVDHYLDDFDGWDGIISNNESLKEFNQKIKKLIVEELNWGLEQDYLVCSECFSRGEAIADSEGFYCRKCHARILH